VKDIVFWIGLAGLIFIFYLILKPEDREKNLKDEK